VTNNKFDEGCDLTKSEAISMNCIALYKAIAGAVRPNSFDLKAYEFTGPVLLLCGTNDNHKIV
jgi:hypothetical protein